MEVQLHKDVSLDLHPDSLMQHEGVLVTKDVDGNAITDQGFNAYHAAREALAEVYTWHALVETADQEFQKYGMKNPRGAARYVAGPQTRVFHGHEEDVYKAAMDGMARALKVSDAKLKFVNRIRDDIAREIDKATDYEQRKTPEGIALATEIRAHVKSLGETKGVALVEQAIRNGDKQVVAAVLRAPSCLSALSAEAAGSLRNLAESLWAPQQYAHRQELDSIIPKVDAAMRGMFDRSTKLSKTLGAAANARQHADKSLKALRGERLAK